MTKPNLKLETGAFILVGMVYLILIIMGSNGFWIIDEGNKYIWGLNFWETGSLTLEDRAELISPGHSSFKAPFSVPSDDGLGEITTFSPFFIILISPLLKLGGLKLALIIPFVVTLLLIGQTKRLAEHFKFPFRWYTVLIMGLASPLLFYSLTLWEHGLAVLLGLLAVNFAVSEKPGYLPRILSGFLFALASYIRPEMAVFALGAWIFLSKDRATVFLSGIGGLIIMMVANWGLTHSFLPLQISANFIHKWGGMDFVDMALTRLDSLYALILEGSEVPYIAAGLIICSAMFFLLPGIFKFLFPLYIIILVIYNWFDETPFFHLGNRSSLLLTAPFFITGIAVKAENIQWKKVKQVVIFTAVLTALCTPVFRGIHYGPRLLLSVVPLLALLSTAFIIHAYQQKSVFKFDAALVLIFAQLLVTIWGVGLLEGRRSANQARTEIIMAQGKPSLITLQWWLPQEMPQIHLTSDTYIAENLLEFKVMLLDFYQEGVRYFTLLLRENESSKILDFFNATPPKRIGAFKVDTEYPSMDLVGLHYAIGFDAEGAAKLADELGVYYGQIEGNLAKSEEYLSKAVAWDGDVGQYRYNLGYTLGMQRKYKEALQQLEIAQQLDPGNKQISKLTISLKKRLEGGD